MALQVSSPRSDPGVGWLVGREKLDSPFNIRSGLLYSNSRTGHSSLARLEIVRREREREKGKEQLSRPRDEAKTEAFLADDRPGNRGTDFLAQRWTMVPLQREALG